MKMMIFIFVLSSNAQINPIPVSKDREEICFSRLSKENGLPSDFIMHAIQDFRGYVWFATNNGLCRFDGKNFTVFRNHPGKTNSIVDNYVIYLHETSDSMLWIGTRQGVSVYNPFTAGFTNYRYHQVKTGLFPCRFIREIVEDENHDLWFACNDGLVYKKHGSALFEKIVLKRPADRTEPETDFNTVTCFARDLRSPGHFFLGTFAGILQFDYIKHQIVKDFPKKFKSRSAVYKLFMDDDQHLWAGGWFIGLNCLDLRTMKWKEFPAAENKTLTVLDIFPRNRDEFWLATIGNGIGIFNKKTGRFRFIRHDILKTYSLISDNINHLGFFNKTRDLWASGSEGVSVENRTIHSFRQIKVPFPFHTISEIYHDIPKHRLYAGSFPGNGLIMFDEVTRQWSMNRPENKVKEGAFVVNQFYRDHRGILWMGTDANLYYLDNMDDKVKLLLLDNQQPLRFQSGMIISVSEDHSGNLWVGTRTEGIAKITPDRKKAFYYKHIPANPQSLNEGPVYRCIRTDHTNKTWICSQGGISMYNQAKDSFDNFLTDTLEKHGHSARQVYNIDFDTLNRMWLTIDGSGLVRISQDQKGKYNFRFFESSEGFEASTISVMRQDREGDLWINNVSLVRFNPYSERFHIYNLHNGLHEPLVVGQKIYSDQNLNIFIAEESGISVKQKYSDIPANGIINLVIEGIEINGEYQSSGYQRNGKVEFNLPARRNNITFFYTAVCFDNQADIKYAYQLVGYDQSWYQSGSTREARYTNLPPGSYTFRFKVLNQPVTPGIKNQVTVVIRPFFWKTWWFVLIIIFIISAVFYFAYLYRIRQLLRMEQLRMQIASDLHDDVGSTLSSVSILSDVLARQLQDTQAKKMLKNIGESSSLMMEKLDDIVWMVNPKNDRFEDLGLRISEFATPLTESRQLGFEYRFDPQLSGIRLQMEARRNIFLIAKEAINNALKYSGCQRITVIFSADYHYLVMMITDDGTGFDPDSPTSRNGLRNMHKRAEQIRASLDIISGPGKGTRIKLTVSTKTNT